MQKNTFPRLPYSFSSCSIFFFLSFFLLLFFCMVFNSAMRTWNKKNERECLCSKIRFTQHNSQNYERDGGREPIDFHLECYFLYLIRLLLLLFAAAVVIVAVVVAFVFLVSFHYQQRELLLDDYTRSRLIMNCFLFFSSLILLKSTELQLNFQHFIIAF